jgi:hypothetical protein
MPSIKTGVIKQMGIIGNLPHVNSPELDELASDKARLGVHLFIGASGAFVAKKLGDEGATRAELAVPTITAVAYLGTGALALWNRVSSEPNS